MFWTNLWNRAVMLDPSIEEICLRLLCAMLVGLVIGTEREYTHRPAGMRTHILVALGACVVAITGELIFRQYRLLGATPDPARLSAQVITGVGFLGAGTIMREGATIRGLTTAASVWVVACLGLAAGSGYYALALAGMVFIFITLTVFEILQKRLMRKNLTRQSYLLETADINQVLKALYRCAEEHRAVVRNLEVEKRENYYHICFQAEFYGNKGEKRHQKFLEKLMEDEAVSALRQTVSV